MDEHEIEGALRQDLSAGTDEFRDGLLSRCLAVLGSDTEIVELSADELDMLAAAGDPSAFGDLGRSKTPGA